MSAVPVALDADIAAMRESTARNDKSVADVDSSIQETQEQISSKKATLDQLTQECENLENLKLSSCDRKVQADHAFQVCACDNSISI